MIYKMQIPPFPVKSFDLLTTRQAKEIFKWYTDDIPARLDQLQKCIDADVNGTVQLTKGKIHCVLCGVGWLLTSNYKS